MDKRLEHIKLKFRMSRSSGPGGQHVNKTSTRVEVLFDLENSTLFSADEKLRISKKLRSYIDSRGIVHVVCDNHRSQPRNRSCAIIRLKNLLDKALAKPKTRIPTGPSKKAIEKRLENKQKHSEKKQRRDKNFPAE